MAKATSPFTGVRLTDQTPLSTVGLDQRLFALPTRQLRPKPKKREEPHEVGKEGSRETGKETSQPAKREIGQLFDLNQKPYRKDSFLFTTEEFEALEDLKLELRRKFDLRATKNDLARCAIHDLIQDYKRHKEGSVVVQRLRNKTVR